VVSLLAEVAANRGEVFRIGCRLHLQ
jgi:hypothetical protein